MFAPEPHESEPVERVGETEREREPARELALDLDLELDLDELTDEIMPVESMNSATSAAVAQETERRERGASEAPGS